MRASELLGRAVVTEQGRGGIIHDVQVRLDDGAPLRVTGLFVGPATTRARLAHAWGYAQGRARGPALVRGWLLRGSISRVVPVAQVRSWDDGGSVLIDDAGES